MYYPENLNYMNFDLNSVYDNISAKKFTFLGTFFVVVLISYAVLYVLDFYPEPVTNVEAAPEERQGSTVLAEEEIVENTESAITEHEFSINSTPADSGMLVLPSRIVIPKSDTDVTILNPDSVNMADLDNALLNGVIRHPQSADLDDRGNMLILGHSSYLPTVFNKNFQAFNGVQDLVWGDTIMVYGEDGAKHTYRVDRVYLAKASETIIDNSWGKSKLTLVTCNSFASKDDRYIVEATLVGVM